MRRLPQPPAPGAAHLMTDAMVGAPGAALLPTDARGEDASGAEGGRRRAMVLKVTLPGGSGTEASIEVHAGDNARDVAANFVRLHSLNPATCIEPIAEEVWIGGLAFSLGH